MNPKDRKRRLEQTNALFNQKEAAPELPTGKVFVQFVTPDGEKSGPQCELPLNTTTEQLELIINDVIQKSDEKLPYSFYVQNVEIAESIGKAVAAASLDTEQVLNVVYLPQAVFRVRPVTRCTGSMSGHSAPVIALNFSPDGTQLVSGSGDSTVRFWDLNTHTPLHECKGHKQWVICLAWSPNGKLVASGGYDGNVFIWNPETGQQHKLLKGHSKWITALAWAPLHTHPECNLLASASKDGTVRVWDIRTERVVMCLSGHTMSVTCLRWGGEGLIYSGSQDRTIKVYAADSGKLVRTLEGHAHWVNTLATSADFALRTGATNHKGEAPTESADMQKVAKERYEQLKGGRAERLASGSDDFTIFLWEPSSGKKPLARLTGHQQPVNQLLFSPDGRILASASFDKSIKLWDGFTGKFITTLRGHVGAVYQIAWSPDSRKLASGSKDSTLKEWDMRTKKMEEELPGHADEVYAVDWSPDGGTVASGGKDRILKIWQC